MTTATAPTADAALARFERIYAACHLTVLNTLRRGMASAWQPMVGSFDESVGGAAPEELAQETWLRVWRKWPEVARAHDDRMLYAYILTTARHVLIDHQRGCQMRRRMGERRLSAAGWEAVYDQLADLARAGQPEATALDAESWREALTLVRSLPHTARTHDHLATLLVAMTLGEPQETTAAKLGAPVSTVRQRKLRLRQALRAQRADAETDAEAGERTGETP